MGPQTTMANRWPRGTCGAITPRLPLPLDPVKVDPIEVYVRIAVVTDQLLELEATALGADESRQQVLDQRQVLVYDSVQVLHLVARHFDPPTARQDAAGEREDFVDAPAIVEQRHEG